MKPAQHVALDDVDRADLAVERRAVECIRFPAGTLRTFQIRPSPASSDPVSVTSCTRSAQNADSVAWARVVRQSENTHMSVNTFIATSMPVWTEAAAAHS
jgi:hypothetical protein